MSRILTAGCAALLTLTISHARALLDSPLVPQGAALRLSALPPPANSLTLSRHTAHPHDSGMHAEGMAGGMGTSMGMPSSVDLLSPMSQEASGTAWLPSSTPMYGRMFMFGPGMPDMLMLHGDFHLRYTDVGSKRGDRRIDAPNWFMAMYSHPLSDRSQLGLRGMFSLDPLTEGGFGYPLLFQTGETWHGQPLHDRQHPHDLVAELAATYSQRLSAKTSAYLYLGYPGEPALGPPTYMHRLTAMDLADAPIGHHWQDATHITWGVATAGVNFGNRWKAEGSWFNGREPDENRYLPDALRLNSYSGRISFNSDSRNACQVSYGFIHNPEGDAVNQHRTTASWGYNRPLGVDANLTTTLVWGQNLLADEGITNSYLAEADWQHGRDTLFGRIENITKSGHELVLPEPVHGRKYNLGAYTLGYVRDLTHGSGTDTGVGAAVTVNTKPPGLDPFYGRGTPVSLQVFLRIRPSRMDHGTAGSAMPGMNDGINASRGGPRLTLTTEPTAPKSGEETTLIVRLVDSEGKPIDGATVTADIDMQAMAMGVQRPRFSGIGDGRYRATAKFSMAGAWRANILARIPGREQPVRRTAIIRVSP